MTDIHKPTSRRTRAEYSVLYPKSRRIVVTLCPGDVLQFRESGRRQSWTLPIDDAFRIAVRCHSGMALCFVPQRKKKAASGPALTQG